MNKAILLDNNLLDTNLAKSLNIYSIPEQKKEIYTYKAYEAYFRGDINTAINNLMFYSAVDDKNVDVLNFLCDLYIKNNNLLLKLGEYYLKKGNFSEAKKYYKTLITLDDNLYEAYFGYIYSLIELDEIEEASVCFKKKMPLLKQKNGENEFLLAKICINAKEYSDALDFLNEALKKDDNLIFRAEIERVNALIKKQEQKQ